MKSFWLMVIFLFSILWIGACTQTEAPQLPQEEEQPQEIEQTFSSTVPENSTKETVSLPTPPPQPLLVNGKTVEERLQEAYDRLHTAGSGEHIRASFPDIEKVYVDNPQGGGFPPQILPFVYYYSKETDRTFNICNIDLTVFICKGKLDRVISKGDIDSNQCTVTPIYINVIR